MEIKLSKDEVEILELVNQRVVDLEARKQAIAKQNRALTRKFQRLQREQVGLTQKVLAAVRRNRPDLTIPDHARPQLDGHGSAILVWPDPKPDPPIPPTPATLADGESKVKQPAIVPTAEVEAQRAQAATTMAEGAKNGARAHA